MKQIGVEPSEQWSEDGAEMDELHAVAAAAGSASLNPAAVADSAAGGGHCPPKKLKRGDDPPSPSREAPRSSNSSSSLAIPGQTGESGASCEEPTPAKPVADLAANTWLGYRRCTKCDVIEPFQDFAYFADRSCRKVEGKQCVFHCSDHKG